ncbi:MAG: heat-inducible transcriptional repressor HrcA [Desulfomonile sp.]|nr:heat-inducible transcriptional repressor HrcA [Desulfomonile sp.]
MHRLESRAETILKTIVSEFIATGEPVGSRTVSRKKGVDLSPASIRYIMTDLTEMGYITQPHVSAGRIPTDRGYRLYVDSLLSGHQNVCVDEQAAIESVIKAAGLEVRSMLRQSSSVLAELSHQAGVVTAATAPERRFRAIEFIKVAENRIVVLLVSASGLVQNKLIHDDDRIDQESLDRYSRMLNDMLKNLDLRQARERIEQELQQEKTRMDAMLAKALRMGHTVLVGEGDHEVFIEGQANILDEPEFASIEQLKALLVTFQDKSKLLKILDKTFQAKGVQVFIGSEHGVGEIESCAIVAYPVHAAQTVVASVAVIGPKRMNYPKVVGLVDATGRVLTKLLAKAADTVL